MFQARLRKALALLTVLALAATPLPGLFPGAAAAPAPAPPGSLDWTADWLAANDRDGDRVEDDAEGVALAAIAAGRPDEGVGVLVTFDRAPGDAERAALVALGADARRMYTFTSIPTVNTVVPAASVAALGGVAGVAAVEWDRPMYASLDISGPATQAVLPRAGPGPYDGFTAEELGYTGAGVLIAVADTGINEFHEAFQPLGPKFVGGADSTAVAPPTCGVQGDEALHGSHVASTAAGNPPGPHRGTAPDANLFEMKIGSAVSLGGINRAFQFILNYNAAIASGSSLCPLVTPQRIDIVTLSFGSHSRGGPNAGATEPLVTGLVSSGVVVTIAAGNCGPQGDSTLCSTLDDESIIDSPGNAAGSITVANSRDKNTISRADDDISGSSSRGPNSHTTANGDPTGAGPSNSAAELRDRHRKPDVSAPGTAILAANGLTPNQYISFSGTSMATPHVAGIAALLLQAGEQVKGQTGGVNLMRPTGTGFNAALHHVPGVHPVRDAIIHSTDYKTAGVPAAMLAKWEGPGAAGLLWNNGHGYGHVNAFAALCWAWSNVLIPGGATAPQPVQDKCLTTPPLAASAGGPYQGFAGIPLGLTGSATGGVAPYTFAWDLDNDGAFDDATGALVQHAFGAAGVYPVAVRVTDSAAATATAVATVVIKAVPPEVLVRSWAFDSPLCTDRQDWWDSVGASTAILPLVPGTPFHLTPLRALGASGCSWYHGIDEVMNHTAQSARNFWGPCMTLPPGVAGGRWDFRIAGQSEATFDFLYARVNKGCLTDQGGGVAQGTSANTVVGTFDGIRGDILAAPPVYDAVSLDISPAVVGGGPVQLGFRFESDILIQEFGFWLDDFRLYLRDSAPALDPVGDRAFPEDQVLAFVLSALDPELDPVTFTATGLPDGATLDGATGAFSWDPVHAQVGSHVVTFCATDGLLQSCETVTLTVQNLPPTAAGSADRAQTDRLTPVGFADASTDAHGGRVVAWLWEFGDGSTSAARHPSHRYAALGLFPVTLTVTDDHGAQDTVAVGSVEVVNLKPAADIGGIPAEANRVEPVAFQDRSTDRDGTVVQWLWDFGDGATSTAQNPSHQYTALGTFTVTLTATDDDGDSDTTTAAVTVVNLLPQVSFTHDPVSPTVFFPVFFDGDATDADGTILSYLWRFGDGGSSTQADPVHVYLNGGSYTVTLTVTDNDGGQSTATRTLFVCAPGADVSTLVAGLERFRLQFEACLRVNEDTLGPEVPDLSSVPGLLGGVVDLLLGLLP